MSNFIATLWRGVSRYFTARKNILSWRGILLALRRMEDQGFVHGFRGEQFALSFAVDSLRAARKNFRNRSDKFNK